MKKSIPDTFLSEITKMKNNDDEVIKLPKNPVYNSLIISRVL